MVNEKACYELAGMRAARGMHSGDYAAFRKWRDIAQQMARTEAPEDREAARDLYRDAYNAEAGVLLNARAGRRAF